MRERMDIIAVLLEGGDDVASELPVRSDDSDVHFVGPIAYTSMPLSSDLKA
jgi:hypothetical protein